MSRSTERRPPDDAPRIDPRPASTEGGERRVCGAKELSEAGALAVDVDERRVAVFWNEGVPKALSETCPHRGGPLHLGQVRDGVVSCPWHLWQFDLETGRSPANPHSRVAAFPARVDAGNVLVRIPEVDGAGG